MELSKKQTHKYKRQNNLLICGWNFEKDNYKTHNRQRILLTYRLLMLRKHTHKREIKDKNENKYLVSFPYHLPSASITV